MRGVASGYLPLRSFEPKRPGAEHWMSEIALFRQIIDETDQADHRFVPENCRICDSRNGFWKVAGYRLYCLDGASRVASAEWIDADDDSIAVNLARLRFDGYECEVWQGRRLVAKLDFRSG